MTTMSKLFILVAFSINILTAQNLNPNYNNSEISIEASQILDEFSQFENKKDSGAIILFREAKMIVNKGGTFETSYHIIGKIFDEYAEADYSQIPVFFNSYYEEIRLEFARTIDRNKSCLNISKDAIQIKTYPDYFGSVKYTDTKILAFSLPALKKNKIFEYKITVKSKRPILKNQWFESFSFNLVLYDLNNPYYLRIDSVITSRFELSVPRGQKIKSELNNIDVPVEKFTAQNIDHYIWRATNLSPIYIEEGMPYLYEVIPTISVSSLFDWKVLGKEVYTDFSKKVIINNTIMSKVEELISNTTTKGEKIKALYDYVRKEINYIQADLNRGGLIPHFSNEILNNKYGDCKDQVTLLISLLKSAGIKAYPALLSTFSYRDHQNYIPTQYFDHVIIYVPTNKKELWLDPTTESNEFPSLNWQNQNRWAFVLNDQGGKFIKTPMSQSEENLGIFSINIGPHKKSLVGRMEILSRGAIMETLSSYLKSYSRREQDYLLRELVQSFYAPIAVNKIDITEAQDINDHYSQVIYFDYLDSTEKFLDFTYVSSIQLAFLTFFIELPSFPDNQNRFFDYRFPFKFALEGTEIFHSPWSHSSHIDIPNDDSLKTEQFNFHQKFKKYKNSVQVDWKFTLHNDQISVYEISRFNENVRKLEYMLLWEVNFHQGLVYFTNKISKTTKTIIVLLLLAFGVFSLIMLIDAYKQEPKKTNSIWLAFILTTGPIGSAVYYFVKKRPRDKLINEKFEELNCSECGEKVKSHDRFCPKCGSVFEENDINDEINESENLKK